MVLAGFHRIEPLVRSGGLERSGRAMTFLAQDDAIGEMAIGRGKGQSAGPFATVRVGGLPIAVMDRRQTALYTVDRAIARSGQHRRCMFHTTANGQVISLCASRSTVRRLVDDADLISADGMSVVFASRMRCPSALPERVATTDTFHDVAAVAAEHGATFYFLGGTEDVVERAARRTRQLYPRLKLVGWHHGHFGRSRDNEIGDEINAAAPDILWVGMGVPRQQEFILGQRERWTHVGVAKTCGGLFDFLAGKNSRAPNWMQSVGLEWFYRAMLEPRRLGWRYLMTNPHAIYVMWTDSGEYPVGG
jgi:exopolysaccharide biosynthesis WecB/TagA/CpsF family protein